MLIDGLESESNELDTMLGKMETTQNKGKDETKAKQLSELSKVEKDYQDLIKEERLHQKELDNQVYHVYRKTKLVKNNISLPLTVQVGNLENYTCKLLCLFCRFQI